jgi:hypothetical protein
VFRANDARPFFENLEENYRSLSSRYSRRSVTNGVQNGRKLVLFCTPARLIGDAIAERSALRDAQKGEFCTHLWDPCRVHRNSTPWCVTSYGAQARTRRLQNSKNSGAWHGFALSAEKPAQN